MRALFIIACLSLGVHCTPQVHVGPTTIVGKDVTGQSRPIEFFGGIPFAQPPIGSLRLELPVPLTLPAGTFTATEYGPACLQSSVPVNGVSEDCLTLNIHRPAGVSRYAKLPVMVWIYGGGFVIGASSNYDGAALVARSMERGTPIIIVTIGYRVGPLGFPQGIEAGQRGALNLGLHDQIVAFDWIQQNINSFGGDNRKVTLAGESAGGVSIVLHMLKSRTRGFARAAIIQSTFSIPQFPPEVTEAAWQSFVAAVPACASSVGTSDTFTCLLSVDSATLQQAMITGGITIQNRAFRPVIDGPNGILPDRTSQLTPRGNLPTLIGANLDEGTLFTRPTISTDTEVHDSVKIMPSLVTPEIQEDVISQIMTQYPDDPTLGSPYGTGTNTFGLSSQFKRSAAITGDFLAHSARRTLSQNMSQAHVPVFSYLFTDSNAIPAPQFAAPSPTRGVCHSGELAYIFGHNVTPATSAMSIRMQDYWLSFINGLTPNDGRGSHRPHWDQYRHNHQFIMNLNGQQTSMIPDTYRSQQISIFQNNPDVFHR